MKIERISDNQIRCILSSHDLQERELQIGELAYGSEKAKEFFRELMEKANLDLGFEVGDIPLVIEAIPTSPDSIILLVTRVDDEEEFEEKFSNLQKIASDYVNESTDEDTIDEMVEEDGTSLQDLEESNSPEDSSKNLPAKVGDDSEFVPLHELMATGEARSYGNRRIKRKSATSYLFSFKSLNNSIKAANAVKYIYDGQNSLWKDEDAGIFFILMSSKHNECKTPLVEVANVVAEFATRENQTYATEEYLNEHFTLLIKDNAIQYLSML
ncbi:MAG: adaptor protein MecA [Eubacterium sp.]|nr:adaptor protein MecA [Eubacterium sp.]